jgi:L-amino acid N-acyltransferase YncA
VAVIRHARPEDLSAIVEIQNYRLHETTHEWTEVDHTVAEWAETLRRKGERGEPVLVAERDGEVVGWTTYGDFRDTTRWEGYRVSVELTIHVRHDQWGGGIGRSLMETLTEHARRAGKAVLVAGIDSTNEESIAFHGRLGFVETARMPGVGQKLGRRLDLVLMQRSLEASERHGDAT